MNYKELYKEDNAAVEERYRLSSERIFKLHNECGLAAPFDDYFKKSAEFIVSIQDLVEYVDKETMKEWTFHELAAYNKSLYSDILPDNYEKSYGNPAFAKSMLGEEYGKLLSFLYTEIRGMIVYAYEYRLVPLVLHSELFLQIYNMFEVAAEENKLPDLKSLKMAVYWFVSDNSDILLTERVRELVDPSLSFAADIIMESNLEDLSYLYCFGEYITENELRMSGYLNSLDDETIQLMADTFTEGYRIGFITTGKDLSKKSTVNIRYCLGFERIIRQAVKNFEKMRLKPIIYRSAVNTINKKLNIRSGYYGAIPNKQFEYDHRGDSALYLDQALVKRKLDVLHSSYEQYKELAYQHAGPAVMEVFGDMPFTPDNKECVYSLSKHQQKLSVQYDNESARIINDYIKGDERSFTIIAFPIPDIGDKFEEIFDEIVKVNTLDYELYQKIQQSIIDVLDMGSAVHIKGKDGNCTDIVVALAKLNNPEKETLFENCVADVNIPVGEVFTSPRLSGTDGVLHVSQVYLKGLKYIDLRLEFKAGKVVKYSCANFDNESANQEFIKENLLFHHDTLPLGEFAIGTNTTAYVMAEKYQIADKLPILIAEKMGPHFAVGDTCYSWAEDTKIYNPDGKEIIARDNEVSALRKKDISQAYFGCHTDITIPYKELESIEVILNDDSRIAIIEDGRFVLDGTEELNRPFSKEKE